MPTLAKDDENKTEETEPVEEEKLPAELSEIKSSE
jgi:hypothetical protein